MIYHIHFRGLYPFYYDPYEQYNNHLSGSQVVNPGPLLARFIKESENNSFIFVVTKEQAPEFKEFIQTYGLNNLIQFEMKEPVTNINYPEHGRRLWMYVLQSPKHFVNDMFEEAEDMFNLAEVVAIHDAVTQDN